MSTSHHSDLGSPKSNHQPKDLAAIAAMLSEAARTLLEFGSLPGLDICVVGSGADCAEGCAAGLAGDGASAQLDECGLAGDFAGFDKDVDEVGDDCDDCAEDETQDLGESGDIGGRGGAYGELRCYRLPRNILERERELLAQHRESEFFQLLGKVHDELSGTVTLMRHVDDSVDFSAYDLYLISRNLSRPLELLDSICSQLADFELVQSEAVPA